MEGASPRPVGWGLGAYVVALIMLAVVMGQADRLPLPTWLVIAGFVVAQVGAAFVLGRWHWLLLGLCPLAAAVAASDQAENLLLPFLTAIFVVPVALVLTALGIGARKLYERRHRLTRARALAVASTLPLALALAIGVIDHNRTVRAERPHPVRIDEAQGRIGAVGLGDTAERVESQLGRAPRWSEDDPVGPLDVSPDDLGEPSSIESPPEKPDRFLRYPQQSFWVGGKRVYSIVTADRAARTSRGVGVGDSMELVKRAYPELHCAEDSIGSDEPIPYPYCAGRTGPRTWIYFGGDYTKPGTPVTAITLLPHRFD